jgi:hypothetical protein
MTLAEFAPVFAVLAKQLRATDADEMDIRAYYAALRDVPLELVQMAAHEMGRSGGARVGEDRHWFPKASEWRERVARVERRRLEQQQHVLRQRALAGLSPLCSACEDTGWSARDGGVVPCGCRKLRRLEVLGRQPMPALPEGEPV